MNQVLTRPQSLFSTLRLPLFWATEERGVNVHEPATLRSEEESVEQRSQVWLGHSQHERSGKLKVNLSGRHL
jgi:hypothetical protein